MTSTPTPNPDRSGSITPGPAPATLWHYWVAYTFTDGNGAGAIASPGPITTAEHVVSLQRLLAEQIRERSVVISTWTLLRTETNDAIAQTAR